MITVTKQENGVLFTFQDSDKYLYGSGTILVPFNSLSIVADESDMITLKKAASNDVFISGRYDTDFGYRSKDDAIDDLKDLLFAETGGGSESGITSGEVQTMIDNSLEDYYTDDEVDAALSGKASVSDVTALENEVATKAEMSAVTAVANDVSTLSGQVATKVATTDFNTYSAATDSRLAEDEEVTAAALNNLQENKADTSAVTTVQQSLSGKQDTLVSGTNIKTINNESILGSGNITISGGGGQSLVYYTEDTSNESATIKVQNDDGLGNRSENSVFVDGSSILIESYNETDDGEGNTANTDTQIVINGLGFSIIADSDDGTDFNETQLDVQPMGAYINSEPIATEPYVDAAISGKADTSAVTAAIDDAKAYYISFATLATVGIHDEDWNGIVAAIDDHRPIYAGYPRTDGGIIYYGVECMNKNSGNTQIVMTASDDNQHYFYTFVKNGSNDYSYTVDTRPYTTNQEKTEWNAKQDALSAGTGIEISGNVISATGGGGATYSAGTNISIANDTINCTLPIIATNTSKVMVGYNNQQYIDYYVKANYGVSIGFTNYINGQRSVCLGSDNQANGYCSVAANSVNTAQTNYSFACGYHSNTSNLYEFACGTYNNSVTGSTASGNTLFSVGNGTSSANHNAFEIRQNGDIYVNDGTNDVRLQDTILALGGLKFVQCSQAEYDALVSGGTVDSSTIYFITNVVS